MKEVWVGLVVGVVCADESSGTSSYGVDELDIVLCTCRAAFCRRGWR